MAITKKKAHAAAVESEKWPFGRKNYILFAVALVVIIAGFISLGMGSITLAPILLVLGYGMIPFAIMARGKPGEDESEPADSVQ